VIEMPGVFVVATIKDWNVRVFENVISKYDGEWHLVSNPKDLTLERLRQINPNCVFFPHWSWIVDKRIVKEFKCVCFHSTDLPFGRGGSPIQNLIQRGFKKTMVTAFVMNDGIDAGDVLLKKRFSLHGNAQNIFERLAVLTAKMIKEIIEKNPEPKPQVGKPVFFKRRKPSQSNVFALKELEKVFDYIRMLDAETYPKAFVLTKFFKISFSRARLEKDKVVCRAEFELRKSEKTGILSV